MPDGISIDVGTALPYLVNSLLGWFGKDALSEEWRLKLERLIKLSSEQAWAVQSIGMAQPIPIQNIYQPAMVIVGRQRLRTEDLVRSRSSVIIRAGPGCGKTTLLHWLYINLVRSEDRIPLLFTLRWPDCPTELCEFIEHLQKQQKILSNNRQKLTLFVDGYDEISVEERQFVSRALMLFKQLELGEFFLTARSNYDVYDIKADSCVIEPFTQADSLRFVIAFSAIYGLEIDPKQLLDELRDHGFADFASHPLMLTLVCILKSGPNREIPRRAIGLIRRAIDTLTLRWDQFRGIRRATDLDLDGEERIRCLMRVAFAMPNLQARAEVVEAAVREHLLLLQRRGGVDARLLLTEIAGWYGILVPVDVDQWQFVHRTIHDYLAARYWVESGGFATAKNLHWDIRSAYATCLLPDGTQFVNRMLREAGDMVAFCECIYNSAPFNCNTVAHTFITRIKSRAQPTVEFNSTCVAVELDGEYCRIFDIAPVEFLVSTCIVGCQIGGLAADAAVLCAVAELSRRGIPLNRRDLGGQIGVFLEQNPLCPIRIRDAKGSITNERLALVRSSG